MNRRRRDDETYAAAVPSSRSRRDRGFSLVEIVVAIALLGTVVVAGIEAVTTSIRVSSTSRSAAQVETAVVNAADRVNRAPSAPKPCDYGRFARAAVLTEGWPASSVSVTQQYYVPSGDPREGGTWETGLPGTPACPNGVATDLLVQRVAITITSPDGKVRRSITVVKSDV